MAITALSITKPVAACLQTQVKKLDTRVTTRALQLSVPSLQSVTSLVFVSKVGDPESIGCVAEVARPDRVTQTELSRVGVGVAAITLGWSAPVRRTTAGAPVFGCG